MNAPVLDTLRCAQTLKAAGFTQQQADGTARILGDALAGVATKEDLAATKKELDEAIAGLRTEVHHGFAAQKAETKSAFAAQKAETKSAFAAQKAETKSALAALRAEVDTRFAAQKADMDAGFSAQKAEITQLHTKFDALDRQLKFVLALLGLLFAMSAYNFLQPGPIAAPAHAEAPQAPTPSEDQASQAAPAEPNRTLPIKPPKDTAPG